MSVDAIARDIADQTAGATYDELRAQEEETRRRLDTWLSAYRAAVATERQQAAFAPPPLTVKEAAELLRVSDTTVRELIRTGKLPRVQNITTVLIPRSAVDRMIGGSA